MKTLGTLIALAFCSTTLFVASRATSVVAAAQYSPDSQSVACSSDDMRLHYCEVDTRGGVQLVRQRSEATCTLGRTWGYDGRGIWVDRGCRADFQVGNVNWGGYGDNYVIYCASDDGGRQFCSTNTTGGVRLARQRSGSPCIFGQSWGYNYRGIWVDHGCRADFQLGDSAWNSSVPTQNISCSSDDMHQRYCNADTSRGVRLIRQRSEADCVYGSTWGYDDRGIWVDRGCRADFQIGGGDGDGDFDDQPYSVRVYCPSDDMHRHTCYIGPNGGVRLVKKRSEANCVEGSTWGQERHRWIWVDRGCRADFEVAVGGENRHRGENYDDRGNYGSSPSVTLNCSSDDMHRHYCKVDTRGGVRLVKQRSGSPCTEGRTWGYDNAGIWVDRGCRADFEVGAHTY